MEIIKMKKFIKILIISLISQTLVISTIVYAKSSHGVSSTSALDFNGDNYNDVVTIKKDLNGKAVADVNLGNSLGTKRYPLRGFFWNNQKWLGGDFTGDGKTDLLCIYTNKNNQIRIWQLTSHGNGFNGSIKTLQKVVSFKSQRWLLHDYNYDGKADLQLTYPKSGKTRRMVFLAKKGTFELKPSVSRLE